MTSQVKYAKDSREKAATSIWSTSIIPLFKHLEESSNDDSSSEDDVPNAHLNIVKAYEDVDKTRKLNLQDSFQY